MSATAATAALVALAALVAPAALAAPVAVAAVRNALKSLPSVERVVFCCFSDGDRRIYEAVLAGEEAEA